MGGGVMTADCQGLSHLPEEVREAYGVSPATFAEFLEEEKEETADTPGAFERTIDDIEEVIRAIEESGEGNEILDHPFLTAAQVVVVKTYLGGELCEILTEKTADAVFEAIRNNDRFLACMLAACDERISDAQGMAILAGMRDQAKHFADPRESESPRP